MIKKILILMLMMSFSISHAISKDKKKDARRKEFYIKGIGWGVFSDFGRFGNFANYNSVSKYNGSSYTYDTIYKKIGKPFGMSIISFGLDNHFILKEFKKEKSVSLNVYPLIGLGFSLNRFLNLSIPIMLCYNVGCVSTYRSKRDGGVTIGLGVEYINPGVIKISDKDVWSEPEPRLGLSVRNSSFIQPCVGLGLRYFNKRQRAKELNLKFGYHNEKPTDLFNKMPASENKSTGSFWFRLTMVHYVHY